MPRRAPLPLLVGGLLVVTACSGASTSDGATTTTPATTTGAATTTGSAAITTSTTRVPPTAAAAPTSTTSATPATTTPATTTTTPDPQLLQTLELGRSVEGRPITAVERGTEGGQVVLVIGVIHGDEDAGVAVIDRLASEPVPEGIDLWLVRSMNPDGQAHQVRHNAHQVDLNRNFPYAWAPLGQPGYWEYGGTSAASEPETQAMVGLVERIRPDLAIWYHQDLNRIAPATGREGQVRRHYAELTGLPVLAVTGGTYTGTAAGWQRRAIPEGVAFIVELGPTLSPTEAIVHADAVLAVVPD